MIFYMSVFVVIKTRFATRRGEYVVETRPSTGVFREEDLRRGSLVMCKACIIFIHSHTRVDGKINISQVYLYNITIKMTEHDRLRREINTKISEKQIEEN